MTGVTKTFLLILIGANCLARMLRKTTSVPASGSMRRPARSAKLTSTRCWPTSTWTRLIATSKRLSAIPTSPHHSLRHRSSPTNSPRCSAQSDRPANKVRPIRSLPLAAVRRTAATHTNALAGTRLAHRLIENLPTKNHHQRFGEIPGLLIAVVVGPLADGLDRALGA